MELRVSDLVFEADVAGDAGSPLVLLLHGFPQTSYSWRHQLPALARAGYFAVAPNQRGYSPRARPPAIEDYATDLLIADARAMASSLGYRRYHLVGHDWGGQLSWLLAARYRRTRQPHRVVATASGGVRPAMKADAAQADRSRHHRAFQIERGAGCWRTCASAAQRCATKGVAEIDVNAYLERLGTRTLDAAINWYRAPRVAGALAMPDVCVTVPTMYLWGDQDG
jgi:pimeloyl-ACP methyl ester carboxylesterase